MADYVEPNPDSVAIATAWALGTGLLMFWAPFVGPMIGGIAAGYRAHSYVRSLAAALAASILLPLALWAMFTFQGPGPFKLYFGLGLWGFALVNALGFVLGALQGAFLARPREGYEAYLARVRSDTAHPRRTRLLRAWHAPEAPV